MLRALARGRSLATQQPGPRNRVVPGGAGSPGPRLPRRPDLGRGPMAPGQGPDRPRDRRDDAIALWSGIAHGHPRWVDARLAIADLRLDDRRGPADQSGLGRGSGKAMDEARSSIRESRDAASEGSEAVAIGLRHRPAGIDPRGRPALATRSRLATTSSRRRPDPDQHRQARLLRMVGAGRLAPLPRGRAGRPARGQGRRARPPSCPAIRLLDRHGGRGRGRGPPPPASA